MAHILNAPLVGSNIRVVRQRLFELSQTEVAERTGVSRSMVRRIEEGRQLPSMQFIYAFGRLDERYIIMGDYLCTRDFSLFPLVALQESASYFRTIDNSSNAFVEAWYKKKAAELRLLNLATQQADPE